MRTVLDKVTIQNAKPTDFVIEPGEIWIDVEIEQPDNHDAHLFIISLGANNLKRVTGYLVSGVLGTLIVINDYDYYYDIIAWRNDGVILN